MKKHRHYLKLYLALAIALLTFLVYLPSLQNDFVDWDDSLYIFLNPHITSLDRSFFNWAFFDLSYGSNWHPLTWVSHAVDYAVWGLNPLGHHLTNNMLHTFNTFLVVLLIMRLIVVARGTTDADTDVSLPDGSVLIAACVTGLLFGLHPLHVESVAWVSERKDLLCALFFLLTLMSYERYVITETARKNLFSWLYNRRYLLTIVFSLLALLSKPMAVSIPAVLLILDWHPFNRIHSLKTFWVAFLEKVPFIALALFSSIMTVLAQKTAIAQQEVLGLQTRMLVAAKSLVLYMWKMLIPHNLIPLYVYPKEMSFVSFEYLFPPLLILGITTACIFAAKKSKLWLVVWSYYVVTLIPVIGIVQAGNQSMADRYTYLPGIGPCLIIGLSVAWTTTRVDKLPGYNLVLKSVGALAVIVLLSAMSYLTVKQIEIWENTISLFSHQIEASPQEYYKAYLIRGKAFTEKGHFEKSVKDFNMAIALNPFFHESYHLRAAVYAKIGQHDKAIEDYTTSIRTRPTLSAYYERGIAFSKNGETDKAIADFRMVVSRNPLDYDAYTRLGVLYGKTGSLNKAIESFEKAIDINPKNQFTYGNRGYAYSLIGDKESALEDFTRALELDDSYTSAYINRGNLYLATGREELAEEDFKKACALGDRGACSRSRDEDLPAVDEE